MSAARGWPADRAHVPFVWIPTRFVRRWSRARGVHGPIPIDHLYQMDPQVVCWPNVFWRPGVRRPKTHIVWKRVVVWPCRRRRQGQKIRPFLNMCGFWPWHPRPPKNHLAKKRFRDPFDSKRPKAQNFLWPSFGRVCFALLKARGRLTGSREASYTWVFP